MKKIETKYYCDICNVQVPEKHKRLSVPYAQLRVKPEEFTTALGTAIVEQKKDKYDIYTAVMDVCDPCLKKIVHVTKTVEQEGNEIKSTKLELKKIPKNGSL